MLSLLRVIDNPGQDVHLAAALVSVMFSFTPDDLTRLRLLAPRGSLYAALLKSEEPKAQAFLETLRALRRLAATASVEELCGEIFARTHYFAAVGAMENGPARRETLRAFTAWAAGVDRAAREGWPRSCGWWTARWKAALCKAAARRCCRRERFPL